MLVSHITTCALETKGIPNTSETHNTTCALETKGGPNTREKYKPICAILRLKTVHWSRSSVNPKNVLNEINSCCEILSRSGYIINCI